MAAPAPALRLSPERPGRLHAHTLTRRALLARGGSLAGALGLASLGSLVPAGSALAADPLRKCVSLGGPQPLRVDAHPNDYRHWGNREYLRDASRTNWVRLWVSWEELQQELEPDTWQSSWRHLNTAPSGRSYLRRLDGQVRAANDDGLGVIVGLYHHFPTWSSGARGKDPASGKWAARKLPADLSPSGPWAWFIAHLLARYNGAHNPVGPHEPAAGEAPAGYHPYLGNPDGARMDALQVCVEPNALYWPQEDVHLRVADMIRSAESLSHSWGGLAVPAPGTGIRILAPGTLDSPDPWEDADRREAVDWRTFTSDVLDALQGFSPRVPVTWSHHNYRDVLREVSAETSRVREVVELLHARNWNGGGGDRSVWLTEGGVNLKSSASEPGARAFQASAIERNFHAMRTLPEVYLWTQHGLNDIPSVSFKSGLRDDFVYRPPAPGAARPAWHTWRELPGAPSP